MSRREILRGEDPNPNEFHNFRYEHLWNNYFYDQESNIIFDIFSIFLRYYFDIFFDVFDVFFRYLFSIKSQFYILSYSMCWRLDLSSFRCKNV